MTSDVAYVTPRSAYDPLVAVINFVVGLGRIAQLTLVVERGGDRRNPDLAVSIVEIRILPRGVLLLLRCLRHIHSTELQSVLGLSLALPMHHE